jgi:uncharacterized protein (TIGR02246 family)
MRRLVGTVAIAGVFGAFGCASTSPAGDAAAEILKIDAEWSRAAQSRDLERIVSYWAEDAVVYPPGAPALVGKPAIREYVGKSLQIPGFSISWKTDQVVVSKSGDLAYGAGTNRVTFAGPDGKTTTVEGKAVTLWRREKDGSWKCVVDIWNDLAPPPTS